MASVTCAHGVQVLDGCPGWGQTRQGSHITLHYCCCVPQLSLKALFGYVSMGREACHWPTPNKIWARSSVGINSFSLINFNETTQTSTHSGWLWHIPFNYISNAAFSDRLRTFFPPFLALEKGSDLEKAFVTAALVYNNSADPEGKLSKAETKSLLHTQFGRFIQVRGFGRAGGTGWVLWVQEWHPGLCPAAGWASEHGVVPCETSVIWYKHLQWVNCFMLSPCLTWG